MKIKQVTGQAVRILLYLAEDDCVQSKEDLCEKTGVPPASFPKIGKTLTFAGLVTGQRGRGLQIARPPEEISLWDIFVAFEGEFNADSCGICDHQCNLENTDTCPMRDVMNTVGTELKRSLSKITLAELIKKEAERIRRAREQAGTSAADKMK